MIFNFTIWIDSQPSFTFRLFFFWKSSSVGSTRLWFRKGLKVFISVKLWITYFYGEILFKIIHIAKGNESIAVETLVYYFWQAPMELGKAGTGFRSIFVSKRCEDYWDKNAAFLSYIAWTQPLRTPPMYSKNPNNLESINFSLDYL